jgi:hypothetical protein
MRTGKIFILKMPELSRQSVEVFLDIHHRTIFFV